MSTAPIVNFPANIRRRLRQFAVSVVDVKSIFLFSVVLVYLFGSCFDVCIVYAKHDDLFVFFIVAACSSGSSGPSRGAMRKKFIFLRKNKKIQPMKYFPAKKGFLILMGGLAGHARLDPPLVAFIALFLCCL